MSFNTPVVMEETPLLSVDDNNDNDNNNSSNSCCSSSSQQKKGFIIGAMMILVLIVFGIGIISNNHRRNKTSLDLESSWNSLEFPKGFLWGAATSSYQIEGAVNEDGRGLSIWDTYCDQPNAISDHSSGAVACDHYHRFKDDVRMMKDLNIQAYRFSIAWPRIFPNGTGELNQKGIDFYNELIDELVKNNIEPVITLYHWDLPQALEDRYGGWLGREIVDDFANYARTCFRAFGDRVKYWITLNESWTVAVQGYNDGSKAPAKLDNPSINVYQAAHNLVLAHARAATIYKQEFVNDNDDATDSNRQGWIGIANCGDFRYPKDPNKVEDVEAAERAMIFQYAWLSDPFFFGDYPKEMRELLGDRLPKFTNKEREELMNGSTDFLGLNHYSTLYAANVDNDSSIGGYWGDMRVRFSTDPSWKKNFMGWSTNPDGCRELLLWISDRYDGATIIITENGTSEDEPNLATSLRDEGRREYFEGYLRACREAIDKGVNLVGYFAWSLMDNFEWEYGYTKRFGICHVDYETQKRTPKRSALWYSEAIESNGANIVARKEPTNRT